MQPHGPLIPYPSLWALPQPLTLTMLPYPQAPRADHSHLGGRPSARDAASG